MIDTNIKVKKSSNLVGNMNERNDIEDKFK